MGKRLDEITKGDKLFVVNTKTFGIKIVEYEVKQVSRDNRNVCLVIENGENVDVISYPVQNGMDLSYGELTAIDIFNIKIIAFSTDSDETKSKYNNLIDVLSCGIKNYIIRL